MTMRPLLALVLLGASPAAAQALKGHDTNAPVDFSADRIEVQDKSNRAVLAGNVHVTQGAMVLDAARMTVAYTGQMQGGKPSVQRLDASGGVTVKSPDQTARGNFGIYDLNRKLITMLGAVTLIQGNNTVRGGRLVIDLNSGRSVMDGSAVSGGGARGTPSAGGRVTGRFSVPQRTQTPPK